MLLTMILLPILGVFSIVLCGHNSFRVPGYDLKIRQIALLCSIIVWILSTLLYVFFLSNMFSPTDQIISTDSLQSSNWYFGYQLQSLSRAGEFKLGVDGLGLIFVLLTTYLIPISILSSWDTVSHHSSSHLICLLVLESTLLIVFTALDLIVFYVSFELVLVPLFIIVGLHGSTSGRIRASLLLFIYTLTGSFFMLLGIIELRLLTGTTDILFLSNNIYMLSPSSQRWIWLGIFFSIAIKSPLVPMHLWLPRAHAEASLAGSILLAGIVLKLATYAYLRILIPILPEATEYFRPLVLTIASITIIHGAFVTFRMVDLKAFVAMSSVSHMGVCIIGIASGTVNGIQGGIILSVAHGLISPALFVITGGVLYDRYHTRIIKYYRGTGSFMPSMKTWFFCASVASMAVPGSLNWIGELLSIEGAFEVAPVAGVLASSSVLLGAIYTIWLFNQVVGGSPSPYIALTNDLVYREWTMLVFLIVPAFVLGIFPSIFNLVS